MPCQPNLFSQCAIAVATASVALLVGACSKNEARETRGAVAEAREVQTIRPQLRPMERVLTVSGSLAAREQAHLSVKVAGRLKTLSVDIGSVVKKGDVIAQVDPRDYELRVQLAEAALAEARAALGISIEGDDKLDPEKTPIVREARAVFDEAKLTHERTIRLHKEKIASQAELDAAESAYKVANQKYRAALEEIRGRQASLAQRVAELELAKQQLTDTNVRVPFDGVIQSRIANLGEYVPGGARVVTLVQVDPLRLQLEISERDAPQVRVGQAVRLTIEGMTETFSGKLNRISPAISELNRMLMVEADIPNAGKLRPGQFVRADIVVNPEEQGLAVPPNALIVFAGVEKAVVVEKGLALEKNVKTARRGDRWIEVASGLKENEVVILNPSGLRTGQPVTTRESQAATSPHSSVQ